MSKKESRIHHLSLGVLIATSVFAAGVIGFSALAKSVRKAVVPEEFRAARLGVLAASARLETLSKEINELVREAGELETAGDKPGTLVAISRAGEKNDAAYAEALALSKELEKMTLALRNIRPPIIQQIAFQAVASEASLVKSFVEYTQNLNSFFNAQTQAVAADLETKRAEAKRYLDAANARRDTINGLSRDFTTLLEQFDKSL